MIRVNLVIVLVFLSLISNVIAEDGKDEYRNRLIEILDELDPELLEPEPFLITKKYILGQALFFDPILSTNKDISCATCHLVKQATGDGQRLSVVKSQAQGIEEIKLHARNTLALWNRDDNTVTSLFWDGRIEVLDPNKNLIRSPLENFLPESIENVLAAQALIPLVSDTEMFSSNCNGDQQSCVKRANTHKTLEDIQNILEAILVRLIGSLNEEASGTQKAYRQLIKNAYPDIALENIDIGHIGNAIAHYEEVAFATRNARWDRFLRGNKNAISEEEAKGAILFFRSFQCVSCHSGPVFSDYKFHTLGLVNTKPDGKVDYGRFEVTKQESDKFKFRTPSLRNVTLTAPYMHDGSVGDLKGAISAHNLECQTEPALMDYCNNLAFSKESASFESITDRQLDGLIEFLGVLEDDAQIYQDFIIPTSVPSGLY